MIPAKSSYGLRFCDIPVKDVAVTAHAGKGGIVLGDGDIQDFVAMRGIGLDKLGCTGRLEGVGARWCGGARRIIEADGTVGRAG